MQQSSGEDRRNGDEEEWSIVGGRKDEVGVEGRTTSPSAETWLELKSSWEIGFTISNKKPRAAKFQSQTKQ